MRIGHNSGGSVGSSKRNNTPERAPYTLHLTPVSADLVHKRIVSVSLLAWIRFGLLSRFQLRNSG